METRKTSSICKRGFALVESVLIRCFLHQVLEHDTCTDARDYLVAFYSIDKTTLRGYLLKQSAPGKYVPIIRFLYCHNSEHASAYVKHSPPFVSFSGVRKGCPISPLLFDFAVGNVLKKSVDGRAGSGVQLLPERGITNLHRQLYIFGFLRRSSSAP